MDAEHFKACVKSYAALHDEITAAAKHLGELRKKNEAVGEVILQFMKQKGIDECELPEHGGKLVRKESKRTEALKKEHILTELLKLASNDSTRAEQCLENIMSHRNIQMKDVLSRTKK